MTAGEGAPGGRRWRPSAIVASMASPLVCYLILRVAASASSPAVALAAATWPPQDARPILKYMAGVAQSPGMRLPGGMAASARTYLVRQPLAFEPFFIAGRAEEQAGRRGKAIELMEEARRRRPSSAATRMQLAAYYLQERRYRPALAQVDLVLRRDPEVRRLAMPQFVQLLGSAEGRDALAPLLLRAGWREDFFRAARVSGVKAADATAFYELIGRIDPRFDRSLERQLVIQSEAAEGRYREARTTWVNALPAAERAANNLLADGSFRRLRAPEPFNWSFADSRSGRAEIARGDRGNYLDVAYFGGSDLVLAEQMLALAPGRYRLAIEARSETGVKTTHLYWKLACAPSGASITAIDLASVKSDFGVFSALLDVPQNACSGQKLSLIAEAGDVAAVVNLQVRSVRLTE
jgi:tetratricopeptide (TPR) repeat protein